MSGAEVPAGMAIADAVGGTALGTSTALGSGLTLGSAGAAGLTASPAAFGALGAAAPGMGGALGSGLTAAATPGLGTALGAAVTPGSFTVPFTVADAIGKAGSGLESMNKANTAMKATGMSQQGQQRQAMQSRPIFSGEQVQISPFGNTQDSGNNFAKMLMMKKMQANGLLG